MESSHRDASGAAARHGKASAGREPGHWRLRARLERSVLWWLVPGAFCFRAVAGWGAEGVMEARPAPALTTEATNILAAFSVRPGFRVELAAAEPLVQAPVAVAFDENGRLFVVERPWDTEPQAAGSHAGQVRLLEDTDGDGVFDTSTVYADNLPWASAVACYAGGIFVAAGSEVIYLRDTKGDGIADARRVVLSGFGGEPSLNDQRLLNNFNWGLDNRIHAATAGLGGFVTTPGQAGAAPVSLAGRDFSFDPSSMAVFPEAGPAQSGLSFDDRGREFACDFARPFRMATYSPRYDARNPFFPEPPTVMDLSAPAPPVFHVVAVEPARREAARLGGTNNAGQTVVAPTEVLAATRVTRAQGCAVYRGSAFPPNYAGNLFVAETEAHAIQRAVARGTGLAVTAERAPDELRTEFLVCRDPAFRPVQVVNGPDGGLYIVDRGPGGNVGRIYRVVPANFKRPEPLRLGKAKTYDLVAALASGDGWRRDTAARLLRERRDATAQSLLDNMLRYSRVPQARLQALHALDGLGFLTEAQVLKGLGDADERVREHAVLLSEKFAANGAVSDTLWEALKAALADPSFAVRYQLAFTLGEVQRPDKALALSQLLWGDFGSIWTENAVLSSCGEDAGRLFVLLAEDPRFRGDAGGIGFLRDLSMMIGVRGRLDDVNTVLSFLRRSGLDGAVYDMAKPHELMIPSGGGTGQGFAIVASLGEGLHRTGSSLALADPQGRLQSFYVEALDVVNDPTATDVFRADAARLLSVSPLVYTGSGQWLLTLLGSRPSQVLQSAATTALGRYNDPRLMDQLLASWQSLPMALRRPVLTALMTRIDRVPLVLAAIEDGRIPARDLSSTQLNFLRTYRDQGISQRAVRILGPVPVRRPEVRARFEPALRLRGAPTRGRQIFLARCAECHLLGGEGTDFGPDLAGGRLLGKERILTAVIEPNVEVRPDYATSVGVTREGENLVGIREEVSRLTFTLRKPDGREVWSLASAQSLPVQSWSLMPVGLEQGLSVQDMADLLEYLVTGAR